MSQRFLDWIAQRAAEDSIRQQMFFMAALAVGLYFAISQWPLKIRPYGKAAVIVSGVVIYAFVLAFSLFTLGVSMGLVR
jgi:F0F1-type ATP synthase membrane subunit c/vacuolar-type H+-ATPase subunit K